MHAVRELRYLILALQREGNRLYAAELRGFGLTPAQAEALALIADQQPLTLTALGELLVCESGTNPSRIVDRLVRAGLVERLSDPESRRQVRLTVTPAGEELAREVANIEQRLESWLEEMLADRPLDPTIALLWTVAAELPAGQALARRLALSGGART